MDDMVDNKLLLMIFCYCELNSVYNFIESDNLRKSSAVKETKT